MSDQNLFLPICGPILLLLISLAAILGMRARFRFSNRLRSAYREKEKIENWTRSYRRNQTLLLRIALISILGALVLGLLLLSGKLFPSTLIVIIFGVLLLLAIMSGTLILIELKRLTR